MTTVDRIPVAARRIATGVSFVLVVALLAAPTAAGAPPADTSPTLANGSHISPSLDGVPVTGSAYAQAQSSYDQIVEKSATDQGRLATATGAISVLSAKRRSLDIRIDRDTLVKSAADRVRAKLRLRLRHLALRAYVGSDSQAETGAALALDSKAVLAARTAITLRREVEESSYREFQKQTSISNAAGSRIDANRAARRDVDRNLAAQQAEQTRSRSDIAWDATERRRRQTVLREARATAYVRDTNVPLVALDAYVNGAELVNQERPACHMSWSLLAGIGQVESHQGTYGGSTVLPNGSVSRPIYGVPLDGSGGNERIVTGTGDFSRAEGPMQFLPSTWAAVAVDGDHDGRADPQNLYDAAATAAAYLCRRGADVSTDAGRRAAVLTYNFSGSYVDLVSSYAADYASALPTIPAT